MKPIRSIEQTRRTYHADSQTDTVHRSSLLAPRIPGAAVDVCFVNHFLLKRGAGEVACRLTALDARGEKIVSRTFPITEPRVHVFELDALVDGEKGGEAGGVAKQEAENYLIEFFTAANLYYPFPAVMVNHRNRSFLNSVHSYNRVLNDVFEDDAINELQVRETSIDVAIDADTDTFALFTAGPTPCRGELEVRLTDGTASEHRRIALDLPRFANQRVSLRDLFGDRPRGADSVLTLKSPPQFMFYGRMLAGRSSLADGAVAANHSFYDCSEIEEYWETGQPSSRVYPVFEGLRTRIRLYPIFSPCRLYAAADLFDADGRPLGALDCGSLVSPSTSVLDFSIDDALAAHGIDGVAGFRLKMWPENGGTPRRINHQIIYEDDQHRSALTASIAISLRHPESFAPHKKGLTWGQVAIGEDLDTRLGLVFDRADDGPGVVRLRLYSEMGLALEEEFELASGAARRIDPSRLLPDLVGRSGERPHYVWYWAESDRPDLAAYSVTRHRETGHCTGDHSF